jgi:hypothetical protein
MDKWNQFKRDKLNLISKSIGNSLKLQEELISCCVRAPSLGMQSFVALLWWKLGCCKIWVGGSSTGNFLGVITTDQVICKIHSNTNITSKTGLSLGEVPLIQQKDFISRIWTWLKSMLITGSTSVSYHFIYQHSNMPTVRLHFMRIGNSAM